VGSGMKMQRTVRTAVSGDSECGSQTDAAARGPADLRERGVESEPFLMTPAGGRVEGSSLRRPERLLVGGKLLAHPLHVSGGVKRGWGLFGHCSVILRGQPSPPGGGGAFGVKKSSHWGGAGVGLAMRLGRRN